MPENNNNRKVPVWLIVILLVGIFTTVIGWVFVSVNRIDGRVEASVTELKNHKADANTLNSQILERLSSIETNLSWIKSALDKKELLSK